jgi:tetratricopeptide (TPR) repeat protein
MTQILTAADTAFACTTPGYVGVASDHASLNSAFFAEYWRCNPGDEAVVQFPLRVPRRGFHEELRDNETAAGSRAWQAQHARVESMARQLGIAQALSMPIHALNVLGTALRYGIFEFPALADLPPPRPGQAHDYQIHLQLYIGRLSTAISDSAPPPYAQIQSLSLLAHQDDALDPEVRSHLFNTYLVASARYRDESVSLADGLLNETSGFLRDYLAQSRPAGFRSCMSHSSLWRGLAMWEGLTSEQKTQCLAQASHCAEQAQPGNPVERLLRAENDVTLNLTLAKWLGRNDPAVKMHYLNRITELDPWDATAYSELALLHYKREQWPEAIRHFDKAIELGPPALGMNSHFRADIELRLGREDSAEHLFRRAARIDPEGLSPRLALFDLLQRQGRRPQARAAAQEILGHPDLRGQLDDHELLALQAA